MTPAHISCGYARRPHEGPAVPLLWSVVVSEPGSTNAHEHDDGDDYEQRNELCVVMVH